MTICLIIMAYLLIGIVATTSAYFTLFSKLVMGDINYVRFFIAMQYLEWGFLSWPIIIPFILIVTRKKR